MTVDWCVLKVAGHSIVYAKGKLDRRVTAEEVMARIAALEKAHEIDQGSLKSAQKCVEAMIQERKELTDLLIGIRIKAQGCGDSSKAKADLIEVLARMKITGGQ